MSKLQLNNIRKTYGSSAVVDDLSLELRSGELVTLLGPSGCGKTTTLRMIAGFIELSGGSIEIDGAEISGARRTVAPRSSAAPLIGPSKKSSTSSKPAIPHRRGPSEPTTTMR